MEAAQSSREISFLLDRHWKGRSSLGALVWLISKKWLLVTSCGHYLVLHQWQAACSPHFPILVLPTACCSYHTGLINQNYYTCRRMFSPLMSPVILYTSFQLCHICNIGSNPLTHWEVFLIQENSSRNFCLEDRGSSLETSQKIG